MLRRLLSIAVAGALACSNSSGGAGPGDAGAQDATADTGADTNGPAQPKQKGTVVDFETLNPIGGATVTLAPGISGTTDATGAYAIPIAAGTKYTASITAPNHAIADFGEVAISGDFDQGRFTLSSVDHSVTARTIFGNYDATKGVMLVSIGRLAGCADIAGTTIAVSPPGQARVRYFRSRMQSPSSVNAGTGEDPAAVIWNIDPNVPITVTLTSPTCMQASAPVIDGTATFSGTITTKPGGDLAGTQLYVSYTRAYLK